MTNDDQSHRKPYPKVEKIELTTIKPEVVIKQYRFFHDALDWLASDERIIWHDGPWCTVCDPDEPGIHHDDCLHERAKWVQSTMEDDDDDSA